MKYYSEVTKELYDSVEALEAGESAAQQTEKERQTDFEAIALAEAEVERARKSLEDAYKALYEANSKYATKWGHATAKDKFSPSVDSFMLTFM